MTPRQKQLLDFLTSHIDEKGYAPSIREMEAALNMNSRSAILEHLDALEETGMIARHPGRSRGIEIKSRLVDQNSFRQFLACRGLEEDFRLFCLAVKEMAA